MLKAAKMKDNSKGDSSLFSETLRQPHMEVFLAVTLESGNLVHDISGTKYSNRGYPFWGRRITTFPDANVEIRRGGHAAQGKEDLDNCKNVDALIRDRLEGVKPCVINYRARQSLAEEEAQVRVN